MNVKVGAGGGFGRGLHGASLTRLFPYRNPGRGRGLPELPPKGPALRPHQCGTHHL